MCFAKRSSPTFLPKLLLFSTFPKQNIISLPIPKKNKMSWCDRVDKKKKKCCRRNLLDYFEKTFPWDCTNQRATPNPNPQRPLVWSADHKLLWWKEARQTRVRSVTLRKQKNRNIGCYAAAGWDYDLCFFWVGGGLFNSTWELNSLSQAPRGYCDHGKVSMEAYWHGAMKVGKVEQGVFLCCVGSHKLRFHDS